MKAVPNATPKPEGELSDATKTLACRVYYNEEGKIREHLIDAIRT